MNNSIFCMTDYFVVKHPDAETNIHICAWNSQNIICRYDFGIDETFGKILPQNI